MASSAVIGVAGSIGCTAIACGDGAASVGAGALIGLRRSEICSAATTSEWSSSEGEADDLERGRTGEECDHAQVSVSRLSSCR